MEDDAFKKLVLDALKDLRSEVERSGQRMSDELRVVRSEVETGFERARLRMDAIAARMEDVENRIEDVGYRLSLLQSTVNQVTDGTTRALDSIASISKRVTRLENPGGE